MKTITKRDAIKTIRTHYIDGVFVESRGRETMDIISPTSGKLIGRVTLGDQEDTRRAIAAAKRAFGVYGRSARDERAQILRQLHAAASARVDDLTAAMVEEYGGVVQFAGPIVQSGVNAFSGGREGASGTAINLHWSVGRPRCCHPDPRVEAPRGAARRGIALHRRRRGDGDRAGTCLMIDLRRAFPP